MPGGQRRRRRRRRRSAAASRALRPGRAASPARGGGASGADVAPPAAAAAAGPVPPGRGPPPRRRRRRAARPGAPGRAARVAALARRAPSRAAPRPGGAPPRGRRALLRRESARPARAADGAGPRRAPRRARALVRAAAAARRGRAVLAPRPLTGLSTVGPVQAGRSSSSPMPTGSRARLVGLVVVAVVGDAARDRPGIVLASSSAAGPDDVLRAAGARDGIGPHVARHRAALPHDLVERDARRRRRR